MKKLVLAAIMSLSSLAMAQQQYHGPYGGGNPHGYDGPGQVDRRELRDEFMVTRERLLRNIDRSEGQPRCRHTTREARRAVMVHDDNIQMFRQQYGRVPVHQWQRMTNNLRDHNRALWQSGCVSRDRY